MTDFSFTLEADPPDPPDPPVTPPAYDMTPPEFVRHMQALLPPGKAWTRRLDALLTKLLEGWAPELARAQARAACLLSEFNPATAIELLDEHEEINGLPDPCGTPPSTTEARQAAMAARLLDRAGHNPADYVAVCEAFGHAGATVHRRPYPPFRAGIGRAGWRAYGDGWAHVFGVAYMADALTGAWAFANTTQTSTTKVAPDSDADAREFTFGPGVATAVKLLTGSPTSVQFCVWLRVATGTADVTIGVYRTGPTLVAQQTFTVDKVWRRYVVRGEHTSGVTSARLSATSEAVEVWGEKVGVVNATLECRFGTISQAHTVPQFWAIGEFVQLLE